MLKFHLKFWKILKNMQEHGNKSGTVDFEDFAWGLEESEATPTGPKTIQLSSRSSWLVSLRLTVGRKGKGRSHTDCSYLRIREKTWSLSCRIKAQMLKKKIKDCKSRNSKKFLFQMLRILLDLDFSKLSWNEVYQYTLLIVSPRVYDETPNNKTVFVCVCVCEVENKFL